MKLLFFHSTWGLDLPTPEEKLQRIKQAEFDGVELGVPDTLKECETMRRALDSTGLAVIVQQWTAGRNAEEHMRSFEQQYERAVTLQPLFVNSHTGRDYFSAADNLEIFDAAARLESAAGVPVLHETHRGRALFSAISTSVFLSLRPELKLTADFSHWCCVHESLLEDQPEPLARAIDHTEHVHARVGHPQGPQVPDPRAPEWRGALRAHLTWWRRTIESCRRKQHDILTICPEFGPPPYTVTLPQNGRPVADLWEINCWMRDWLRKELAH
jgi:sugar phosphate isomerase/epimerase